jgi:hypothetical protein
MSGGLTQTNRFGKLDLVLTLPPFSICLWHHRKWSPVDDDHKYPKPQSEINQYCFWSKAEIINERIVLRRKEMFAPSLNAMGNGTVACYICFICLHTFRVSSFPLQTNRSIYNVEYLRLVYVSFCLPFKYTGL